MKVCTDACILGAWSAEKVLKLYPGVTKILDIGCGTGLLSLMLAQKTTAFIDAIEMDAAAAEQAKENILQSAWKEKVQVANIALQEFKPDTQYDFIICNPPFFEDDLKSPDETKNASKHGTTLTFDHLVSFIKENLTKDGFASVLIPYHRTDYFSSLLKKNELFITESLFIKQSPAHPYFRSILLFSHTIVQPIESNELTIHDKERIYTDAFKELLKDYYLKL